MGALSKVILIVIVIAAFGGAYVYSSYVKPLSAFQIQPGEAEIVSVEPLVVRVTMEIVNPGKPVVLPGADLNLYLGDQLIGEGTLPKEVISSGSNKLQAEITLNKKIEELITLVESGEQLSVDGTLYFKVLSYTFTVPIPRFPLPASFDIAELFGGEPPILTFLLLLSLLA